MRGGGEPATATIMRIMRQQLVQSLLSFGFLVFSRLLHCEPRTGLIRASPLGTGLGDFQGISRRRDRS